MISEVLRIPTVWVPKTNLTKTGGWGLPVGLVDMERLGATSCPLRTGMERQTLHREKTLVGGERERAMGHRGVCHRASRGAVATPQPSAGVWA